LFLVDELKVEERKDIRFVDGFWEVEVKGIDSFDSWEVGLSDAAVFDEFLFSYGRFLLSEDQEDICRGEIVNGGFSSMFLRGCLPCPSDGDL